MDLVERCGERRTSKSHLPNAVAAGSSRALSTYLIRHADFTTGHSTGGRSGHPKFPRIVALSPTVEGSLWLSAPRLYQFGRIRSC